MRSPSAVCLNERVGGPSVFPYQPEGLWEEIVVRRRLLRAELSRRATATDLYRRSMYTFWKRTSPPPALIDASTRRIARSAPRAARVTNTPLQALVLLNDPTYVEAARGLAERDAERSAAESQSRRIDSRFGWPPRARRRRDELRLLRDLARSELADHIELSPTEAGKLLAIGESQADQRLETRRTGRLDHGRQHHPEPRRNDHQGIAHDARK